MIFHFLKDYKNIFHKKIVKVDKPSVKMIQKILDKEKIKYESPGVREYEGKAVTVHILTRSIAFLVSSQSNLRKRRKKFEEDAKIWKKMGIDCYVTIDDHVLRAEKIGHLKEYVLRVVRPKK